jgi:hypothetical protein
MLTLREARIASASKAAFFTQSGKSEIVLSSLTNNAAALMADTNATINAEGNYIAGNGIAIQIKAGSILRLSNNDIMNNMVGIGSGGGSILTFGNNKRSGNGSSAPWPTTKILTF